MLQDVSWLLLRLEFINVSCFAYRGTRKLRQSHFTLVSQFFNYFGVVVPTIQMRSLSSP